MNAREEFTRMMAWLVQNVDEVESEQIKADIALLLGTASHFVTKLSDRNAALAKQYRSRKSKPPKSAPVSGPQKENGGKNCTDSSGSQDNSEDRSTGQSRIMQGVQQAEPTMADQRRAALNKAYGVQNNDVAFRKTAKAIAS